MSILNFALAMQEPLKVKASEKFCKKQHWHGAIEHWHQDGASDAPGHQHSDATSDDLHLGARDEEEAVPKTVASLDADAIWSLFPAQLQAIRAGQKYVLVADKVLTLDDFVTEVHAAASKKDKDKNTGKDLAIPGVQPEPKRKATGETESDHFKQLLEPQSRDAVVISKKPGKNGKIYEYKKVSMQDLHDHQADYCLALWVRTPEEGREQAKKLEECRADNVILPNTWPADKSPHSLSPKEIKALPTEADKLNLLRRSDVTAGLMYGETLAVVEDVVAAKS